MKAFIVFACLVAFSTATPKVQKRDHLRIVQNSRFEFDLTFLDKLFDRFITLLKINDPIHVENKTVFEYSGMHVKVVNFYAEGFSHIFTNASFDFGFPENKVKFELYLPEIVASVELFDIETPIVYGKGSASFILKNANFSITIAYDLINGLIPTQVTISVQKANLEITGLNNDEELSQTVSETVNNFLNNFLNSPKTHQTIGNAIDSAINTILGNKN